MERPSVRPSLEHPQVQVSEFRRSAACGPDVLEGGVVENVLQTTVSNKTQSDS